jgi:hypothetical protein
VKDTRTGLEWVVGPDRDMTWDQRLCRPLRGRIWEKP